MITKKMAAVSNNPGRDALAKCCVLCLFFTTSIRHLLCLFLSSPFSFFNGDLYTDTHTFSTGVFPFTCDSTPSSTKHNTPLFLYYCYYYHHFGSFLLFLNVLKVLFVVDLSHSLVYPFFPFSLPLPLFKLYLTSLLTAHNVHNRRPRSEPSGVAEALKKKKTSKKESRQSIMRHPSSALVLVQLSADGKLTKSTSVKSLPNSVGKDGSTAAQTPLRHPRNCRIDYSKYKTRLCRHFVRGMPCPFGDRCVFAHIEEVEKMVVKVPASMPASPLDPRMRIYTPETESLPEEDCRSSECCGDCYVRPCSDGQQQQQSSAALPPPPSYEAALETEKGVTSSESFLPPSYPLRYRFDPYSPQGIAYVHA
jgi:hypothetical protein